MNFNEITYLIIVCWLSLALVWLYIKFRTRNLPSFEQALSLYAQSYKDIKLLSEQQSEILNRRIVVLNTERDKLLEEYDEPDKTLH